MARLTVIGATGSLGKHLARQAVDLGHEVSVLVRTPTRLPDALKTRVAVRPCDLAGTSRHELAALLARQDAVVNAAGTVSEGQAFVDLVASVVEALESLPSSDRPVCWFMAGVGVLEIDASGRRGVDLPRLRKTYWPHRANHERLSRSSLDWRLLCPGPMVEGPPIGPGRLRASVERLPVPVPAFGPWLPGALFLPVFAGLIPQMIVPYADAAAFVLAHLAPGGELSRRRVGIALPPGMRGKKDRWIAQRSPPA